MTLTGLFDTILHTEYIQLSEETASYRYRRRGGRLELYFEWSNGPTDWYNNLDFPALPYREMEDRWYAHRGFLRVWKVLEEVLSAPILSPDVQKILIGGYSHGAAIALLCHEYARFHRPELAGAIQSYGFGCPRVLWGPVRPRVAARFAGFHVVRNGRDIVTHVPPALFGFRHVGDLWEIGQGDAVSAIDAHRPEAYLSALARSPFGDTAVDAF